MGSNVATQGKTVTHDKPHRACIDVIASKFERCSRSKPSFFVSRSSIS